MAGLRCGWAVPVLIYPQAPHSPLHNPTTMEEPLEESPPSTLPGSLLSQLMIPSLQWLQRKGGVEVILRLADSVAAEPETAHHCAQAPAGFRQISPLCPRSLVQRWRVGIASQKGLLGCIFFSQQLPFKERTLNLLPRELTSGPEMGCHCLQGDSPFLESDRSTDSCKTQEQRKVS